MKQIFNNVTNIDYTNSLTKNYDLINASYHKELFDDSMNIKSNNRISLCFCCKKQMEIQEGIVFFNSNWFHNSCWKKFGEKNE
jgi:hypothetical protein